MCPAWQVVMENYGFRDKHQLCLLYLSGLLTPLFAVCHVELDLSEEAEPRWQPAYQGPSTAAISGAA